MILRPFAPVSATVLACLLAWLGWSELDRLRGTLVWDLRIVLAGAGTILLLCLADWLSRDSVERPEDDED